MVFFLTFLSCLTFRSKLISFCSFIHNDLRMANMLNSFFFVIFWDIVSHYLASNVFDFLEGLDNGCTFSYFCQPTRHFFTFPRADLKFLVAFLNHFFWNRVSLKCKSKWILWPSSSFQKLPHFTYLRINIYRFGIYISILRSKLLLIWFVKKTPIFKK